MNNARCHFCTLLTCSSRLDFRSWIPSSSRLRLISCESKALFLYDFSRAFGRVAIFTTGQEKAPKSYKEWTTSDREIENNSANFSALFPGWRAST